LSDLAGQLHWDGRDGIARPRLPSRLNVGVWDTTDLLSRFIRPGASVLEVGFAPGKYLLWCAKAAQARAHGVEYAPESFDRSRRLFDEAGIIADLRLEDFLKTTFKPATFDLVYSLGVIEHFTGDALVRMVQKHLELVKPGGTALIVIPNFRSPLYGGVQRFLDPENLGIHNLDIMTREALENLVPDGATAKAYRYGRLTPWILSFDKRMPRALASVLSASLNALGLVQPIAVQGLCPWLVLQLEHSPSGYAEA
jgi:SAM-dependent methyltransferase